MRDGRSTAYLAGLQTRAMRGVHPSLNNVATAVVVVGIVVRIVSVVVPGAMRPVAVAVVPVVAAMKASNARAGAAVKSSREGATVKTTATKAAHAASAKAAAPVSAAT